MSDEEKKTEISVQTQEKEYEQTVKSWFLF